MTRGKLFIILCLLLTLKSNSQDLSAIFEKVSPAVVAIHTEESSIITSPSSNSEKVTNKGLGSGFLISNKLVVTAAHVVKVPDKIIVQFSDGKTTTAKVVASYSGADIALIELFIPRINPTIIKFGDSDKLKIGQEVFVLGNPLGVGLSLSSGHISAFKKQSLGKNPFTNTEFIQTDASINQGNSGGPMFNLDGEVVGIVSHITSISGGSDGIGYATSSNLAAKLLLNNKMPWFGAELYSLSGKQAKLFNLPQPSGLLVQRVASSSIFESMGVREGNVEVTIAKQKLIMGGDIILSFNDIQYEVSDESLIKIADFANKLIENPEFEMKVLRDGKIITLYNK